MQGYNINTEMQNVFVMGYSPKILEKRIKDRMISSVLYIIKGEYRYRFSGGEFTAHGGDAVYLPKGSSYFYEVISRDTKVVQVEFNLILISKDGRNFIKFSDNPLKISGQAYTLAPMFEKMQDAYYKDDFLTVSLLYGVIAAIKSRASNTSQNGDFEKILPAVSFIEANLCEKVYIEYLAKICSLSQSHLRRLFLKCTGMSPIKYKNTLIIKAACNMLLNQGMNVTETAEALNFSDIYTFSQLFKKEMGISPQKFIKNKKP